MADPDRSRIHAELEKHFERHGNPRFFLSLIVALTGVVGFFVSHTLLHFGEVEMWIRYPVSVGAAYVIFLASLRIWAEIERKNFDPNATQRLANEHRPSPVGKSPSDWPSWLDPFNLTDLGMADEGCVVGCVFTLVVIAVGGAVITVIASAPALIADVFLDAVLMAILYKRLKTAAQQHWLGTAIKRTWGPMLITAVALSIAGGVVQWHWPKARSIGDMWRTEPRKYWKD